VSRPTTDSKLLQAEQWMLETFGKGMQDYVDAAERDPISVCVIDIDKVLKKSRARELLLQWREEDVKSGAGRHAVLTPACALTLILMQLRLRRPTLITEMVSTFRHLSKTQRTILGIVHDGHDDRIYNRIWAAIQRLIALVDEFPGRRDKILTGVEFREMVNARNAADCAMRRNRMFALGNALLEGSRLCMPKELLDRSDGNISLDATFVGLYGKSGNQSPENLTGDRRTTNPDGGWYQREGSHGAVTHLDAEVFNKADASKKYKGTPEGKRNWGIEIEIARMNPNLHEEGRQFPLLTVGVSYHIPGAIVGEGVRIADSLLERGHKPNLFIVDRAYSNGLYFEYAVPLRLRGYKHVFNYRENDFGEQAFDPRGFVQISGAWYLDTLPTVLRGADKVVNTARNTYKATKTKIKSSALSAAEKEKGLSTARKVRNLADVLYLQQSVQREKSRLKPKGRMQTDWSRRYTIPTESPDYAKWKVKPGAHPGVTVDMKRPVGTEADKANAGGLKHEQYYPWGSSEWTAANGMRNGVESVNRNLKRSQYEDIADAEKRAIRGNTFTYLVVAIASVVENLRMILKFYKERLQIKVLTAKNNRLPDSFWQSPKPTDGSESDPPD
jgi:hypothetical protein